MSGGQSRSWFADQSVECLQEGLQAFRLRGKAALSDGRHGHPSKLRGAARALLEEQCRQATRIYFTNRLR
jgi:hypothetical protein